MIDPILEANNIGIKIPEHSSKQVHPLDLIAFNLHRNRSKMFLTITYYTLQNNQILFIIDVLDYITSESYITTTFEVISVYRTRLKSLDIYTANAYCANRTK